jgi:hypothetical protein
MRGVTLCLLVALIALCSLAVVDGRNSYLHAHWRVGHPVQSEQLHRIRLALKQQNIEELKQFVARVSDPRHVNYGQYMTLEEVADMVAPSVKQVKKLQSILYQAGALNVTITKSRDFASVLLPVKAIQRLFSFADGSPLQLHSHSHRHSSRRVLRSKHGAEWSMVPELAEHVELVTGLSDFFDFPSERRAAKRHAARRAQRKALALKAQGEVLTKRQASCANSAPDFGRLKSSHEDVAISVIVYCQNGNPTADPVNPCSDFPPIASSITVRLIPRAHDTQIITSEIKDLDCELDANSQVVCLVRHDWNAQAQRNSELRTV